MRLPLSGHATGGVCLALAALAACAPELAGPPAPPESSVPAFVGSPPGDVEPYLGTQQLTVLLVNTDPEPSHTDELFLFQADQIISEFRDVMGVNSAGRLQFDIQTVGPLHLPHSLCDPVDPAWAQMQQRIFAAAVPAADSAVDFSLAHQIVVIHIGGANCYAGYSSYRRKLWDVTTAEGQLDASLAFMTGAVGAPYSLAMVHELTHTIGATHGDPRICTSSGVRLLVDHSPPGVHEQVCQFAPPLYTGLDPMSFGMFHFSASHKIRWGWIAPGEVKSVITGTYLLYPTEGPFHGSRPKALRLPIKSEFFHSMLLEYRASKKPIAAGLEFGQQAGVYLYADYSDPVFAQAELIEPLDGNSSLTEFATRPLPIGVPVTDPATGVTILVLQIAEGAAKITVTRSPPQP